MLEFFGGVIATAIVLFAIEAVQRRKRMRRWAYEDAYYGHCSGCTVPEEGGAQ